MPKYHRKLERGRGCLWVSLAFPRALYGDRRPAQVSEALCDPECWQLAKQVFELGLSDPHSDVSDSFTPKNHL